MTSRLRFLALLPALAGLWLLPACSTNPATGEQSFTAFMSEEDEARIGAEDHPKILKEFGGAYDGLEVGAYVARLGAKLAALSELPKIQWRFTVLNAPQVNAFALPGGYVYITRGLMALAETEAEVAGVLAHEIGHVTARHTAQRISTAKATNIGLTVLGVLGSVAGVPSSLGQVANFGAQAAIQQYSQSQEFEADTLGVRYMTRAGYTPDGMTSFFRKLKAHQELTAQEKGESDVAHSILSSHPRTEDRITQAIQLAKEKTITHQKIGRDAYLKAIDGLVFGDDPSQGVRRGRTFLHPDLRVVFQVPPDFVLLNSPRQVVAFGPEKSEIRFSMINPKEAQSVRSLTDYVSQVWGRSLSDSQGLERLTVNGMEGATVQGTLASADGPRVVRLVVVRGDRDHIFRLAFITAPSEANRLAVELRRTTYSLRRMSEAEAKAVQPLRLRLHKVRPGDSVADLARRFPFERFQREWFRLLNDIGPGEALTPGQMVKLVAG